MSLSQLVAPHLPYLRRLSRALTGSQTSGDAHAVAALEAIVADPDLLRRDIAPRVALFRVLLDIWQRVPTNRAEGADAPVGAIERHAGQALSVLGLRARAAFLLDVLEGLSREEIGQALGASPEEVDRLVQEASREISAQIASDVLIIEDEPIIAMDIEALVEGLGHRVTGIARTHAEAVASVAVHRPGLVLADIQLADGSSGLDAVNEILTRIEVPVIFITAYPERLLTGERPEPAFLITKPFSVDAVRAVISQALFFGQQAQGPASRAAAG
ncbi:CheY-like chemotaxis protein/DNA-directed RNA polymerase specialized sigma24 family protein [Pseudochelatococcus lubricantis]|uniref:CheY-like chemotaxis protein/DNA-directed RNA polymerase specialized sigma24 family protein n=1 Tax=Pseudochelatococcus lubricantis TaxID=1538102 RepID=A0ABX0UZZ0_9HYPH|nr:response regulator [Pseudochelatococcus lubricantis]NIJ57145.1 CheY-like chemotaxis protein/DNA-directed RNA polymerase specialized sigma24 family protein [Pseudochelatococcus lubricantis]